jgi:tetratricopeptide (TPR) repeat protein
VPRYRLGLATTLSELADITLQFRQLGSKEPLDEARQQLERAVRLYEQLAAEIGADADYQSQAALCYAGMARLLWFEGQRDEASAYHARAAQTYRALHERHPDGPVTLFAWGHLDQLWGTLLLQAGRDEQAREVLLQSVERLRQGLRLDPEREIPRITLRDALSDLADTHAALGELAEAAVAAGELIEMLPDDWLAKERAAQALLACASEARSGGEEDRAREFAAAALRAGEAAMAAQERANDDFKSNPFWPVMLARTAARHADALAFLDRDREAVEHLRRAIALWLPSTEQSGRHPSAGTQAQVRQAFARLAALLQELDDHAGLAGSAEAMATALSTEPADQVEAACAYGAAAGIAAAAGAAEAAEGYATAALDRLRAAIDAGFAGADRLDDPRLETVRARPEFADLRRRLQPR